MRPETIPHGYCHCGCGEKTRLARQNHAKCGFVRGQPIKFILGHNARRRGPDYEVQSAGYTTPCWLWNGALIQGGYGRYQRGPKGQPAHRAYYEKLVGPIPDGLDLDHLCRVRRCVNPSHLEPVTAAENTRRGASAKLTTDNVREIRKLLKSGVGKTELAKRFGVHKASIWKIHYGQRWQGIA